MYKIIISFCCFALLQASFLSAQSNKPFFSDLDVFGLEWATDPQISPDGQQVVYVRRGMDIMQDKKTARLWIVKTDGTEHQKLSNNDINEGNPTWSPDGKQIAFTASTEQGTELFVYWVNTGKVARLSQLEFSPLNLSWSPDGKWIAFSMFVEGSELSLVKAPKKPKGANWADAPRVTTRLKHEADGSGYMEPGFYHLFIMPAEGGTPRQVTSGDFNHGSKPHWSNDGHQLFFSANRSEDWEYTWRNSEIYRVDIASGEIKSLTDRKGPDTGLSVSPDGNTIAYLGYDDNLQAYQHTNIYLMKTDGSGKKRMPNNIDRSFESLVWNSNGKGLYFQYDDHGHTKIGHVDLSGKVTEICSSLGGTSIGRPYTSGSFSINKDNNIALTHSSPYHPAEVGFLNHGATKAKPLTNLNHDLLGQRTLGKVENIRYQSTVDGLPLEGWVVYPPNFDAAKTYPLMVENHGGPILSYGNYFSAEIQLYAAAGYIVFYPNPRGSTGYGEKFANLLYHNYPGEDYQDVMDGVDILLKNSFCSEDSLFVTGGSAGGIMTAWMIGKNNRFEAAAVVKPVVNWISKTLVADNYYGYAHSRYPGQPWENPMEYWKFSPISLVGNVQTPTLVMVGLEDLRTPPSEAKQLYHALKLRKVETALVEIPGASHGIAGRPSQLITKVAHVLAWFDRYR